MVLILQIVLIQAVVLNSDGVFFLNFFVDMFFFFAKI